MYVQLGNSAAKEATRGPDGALIHRDLPGRRITTVVIPDTYSLAEAAATVLAADGAWNHHSHGDNVGDSTPDWVASDRPGLADLLAAELGCPVGRPKDWEAED